MPRAGTVTSPRARAGCTGAGSLLSFGMQAKILAHCVSDDCESALSLCRPGGWAPGAEPGCVGWLVSEDSDLIPETEEQNCHGAALATGPEGRLLAACKPLVSG